MFYLKYIHPACHESQNAANTCITDVLYVVVYFYILKARTLTVILRRKEKHSQECCSDEAELGLWFNSVLRSVFPK